MGGEELPAIAEARYIVAKLNRACQALPAVVHWEIDEHSVESNGTCGQFWIYGNFTSGHTVHSRWHTSRRRSGVDESVLILYRNSMRLIGGAIRQVFRELRRADRAIVVTHHTVQAPRVFKYPEKKEGSTQSVYWNDLYAITFYLCEESQVIYIPTQCSATKSPKITKR